VLGEAERELIEVDAAYRAWRAAVIVRSDPKLAEWRVKAMIEAGAEFMSHKRNIARCESNITVASRMFDAFAKKANVLQSKGANVRAEVERIGLATPASPRPKSARTEAAEVEAETRPRREGPMAKPHKMSDD
jgi:hypothetical protein